MKTIILYLFIVPYTTLYSQNQGRNKSETTLNLLGLNRKETEVKQTSGSDRDDSTRRADYETFISKTIGLNSEAVKANFSIDVAENPTLKLSLPLFTQPKYQFYIDGKLSSTNDYTPIIKKGEWEPDASINLTYAVFLRRVTRFYTREFTTKEAISKAPLRDASQIFWLWLSFKGGTSYASYNFYNDSSHITYDKVTYEKSYTKRFIKASANFFFYPSKDYLRWLNFSGNAGYQFIENDNNYTTLETFEVKTYKTITGANGNSSQVLIDESEAARGKLLVSDAHVFDFNLLALINFTEHFYTGLGFYGKRTLNSNYHKTDFGFSLNVPVQQGEEKTLVNLTLKFEVPDFFNEIEYKVWRDKGKIGFTIGLPIGNYHPRYLRKNR